MRRKTRWDLVTLLCIGMFPADVYGLFPVPRNARDEVVQVLDPKDVHLVDSSDMDCVVEPVVIPLEPHLTE